MSDTGGPRGTGAGAGGADLDARRRRLLLWIPAAVFASVAGTLAGAAYRFLRPSASAGAARGAAGEWADVAMISELAGPDPVLRKVVVEKGEGWNVVREERAVYVLAESREVVSAVCTHEQCEVAWSAARGVFACPCHDSAFDPSGRRLGGPAPRDLDRLPARVEGGRLQILVEGPGQSS